MREARMLRGFFGLVLCLTPVLPALAADAATSAPAAAPAATTTSAPTRPLVVAHRGASGYMPEHTVEAYSLAIAQGADYIEADLVGTKDGYLVARHENNLADTTDVAKRFPDRKKKKVIDGKAVEGWFTEDFTLDELSTVRATERLPFRSQGYNGRYQIPTLADILVLRSAKSRELGRMIGVYIEVKHPGYFRSIGKPLEEPLISILRAWALDRPGSPVFLQAFEADSVKRMAAETSVPTIFLLSKAGPETTDEGLKAIAAYAAGIGPAKTMILPMDAKGQVGKPTDLVERAHKAGLLVHPYTFRPEVQFLPLNYGGDSAREYCQFAALGIDGLFTDTPDLALKAFRESCPMSGNSPR
jgi:glycerophosphoryl diester phosphodiesterase